MYEQEIIEGGEGGAGEVTEDGIKEVEEKPVVDGAEQEIIEGGEGGAGEVTEDGIKEVEEKPVVDGAEQEVDTPVAENPAQEIEQVGQVEVGRIEHEPERRTFGRPSPDHPM